MVTNSFSKSLTLFDRIQHVEIITFAGIFTRIRENVIKQNI